ncbi:hypothetical protein ACKFKF_21775 [Phormidesmis sp. 146-12]
MKKYWLLSASAALVVSVLPINGSPAIAQIFNAGSTIAQNVLRQPKVNLNLVADQKVVKKDAQGKEMTSWRPVDGKVKAKSGDVFRFTVTGENEGTREAKNFVITQPVPKGTVYELSTATVAQGITATYSIDQGKTFVVRPMVKVTLPGGKVEERPAPATAYTHVRWSIAQDLSPNASVAAAYQVKVR